jgi:hypothetical protein
MATKKTHSEFQAPGLDGVPPTQGRTDHTEFKAPNPDDAASSAVEAEIEAFLSGVAGEVLEAKAELEKLLTSNSGESEGPQSQAAMDANIVGVGIGLGDGRSTAAAPGDAVLEVYTLEPESSSELRARLADVTGASVFSGSDIPIHVVHTGVIDAQSHRMRLRPAPGGISCGHVGITAGTLGCLVRGNSAPRNGRLMILSNNHVVANTNAGPLGASIVQAGPLDGGRHPADQVAILERFVPINFGAGAANVVDCATAWAWPDRVRRELMYISGSAVNLFRVGSVPVAPFVGMQVGKTGRTTQLTRGGITAVGVTVNVNFGGGRVARFVNQIAVRSPSGNFSAGGDSGSLIWTWDARRAPVALLFAGGGGTTFGNPITQVLAALDVQMVV